MYIFKRNLWGVTQELLSFPLLSWSFKPNYSHMVPVKYYKKSVNW